MLEEDKLLSPNTVKNDSVERFSIRPKSLQTYKGQPEVVSQLEVFIASAIKRQVPLDHVLIFGPPGLGKTTLAHIIANEMQVQCKQTSGPILEKAGDLAAILTQLEENEVLFIDEIHRLSPQVEEVLYPALEDGQLDVLIGQGPGARSVKIDLPNFTLVGATTRTGLLTSPLRDRFGVNLHLNYYNVSDLTDIVCVSAEVQDMNIEPKAAHKIASSARGTPRIANRLLRRVWDYAVVHYDHKITEECSFQALKLLNVDGHGLDGVDRQYLTLIKQIYKGGPVGVEAISASLGESRDTVEEVLEPYLIQKGYIARTQRGRMLTEKAVDYLNTVEING
jgi:holliday junction DNA helicase RuvB